MKIKTILLVDDHGFIRKGIKEILLENKDVKSVEECSNGSSAIQRIRRHQFDLLVLDISLPGLDGLDVLKQVKSEFPKLPVLILTAHSERVYAKRALKAGASGFLMKTSPIDDILKALDVISQGKIYFSEAFKSQLAEECVRGGGPDRTHVSLADREFQVLCLLGKGERVKEIAVKLHLSVQTVSTYRARILKKLNLENNAELVAYVHSNRLL